MQIDKDQIGIESYPKSQISGQITSVPIKGVRLWYPKVDKENPDIDIRIQIKRSQIKNKDLAQTLMDLILEEC